MTGKTVLSIIIPAYNAECYIKRSLACLLDQNTEKIEIIVVNDGSKDGTLRAAEHAIADNALCNTFIYSKENGGVSSARNLGLDKARGDYVFFLDADDYVSKNFIEELLRLTESSKADVIYWPYDLVDERGIVVVSYPYGQVFPAAVSGATVLQAILVDRSTRICTDSVVFKRQLLMDQKIRYTEGCAAGEDQEFILTSLISARSVLFSDKPRSCYVQQPLSVMNSYSIKKFSAVEAMERTGARFLAVGRPELEVLARQMEDYESLHSYAGTFAMCLRHLITNEHMGLTAATTRLVGDIEAMYPGLQKRISEKLKSRKRTMLPDKLDIFRLSPAVYMYLSNFRQPAMPR